MRPLRQTLSNDEFTSSSQIYKFLKLCIISVNNNIQNMTFNLLKVKFAGP